MIVSYLDLTWCIICSFLAHKILQPSLPIPFHVTCTEIYPEIDPSAKPTDLFWDCLPIFKYLPFSPRELYRLVSPGMI